MKISPKASHIPDTLRASFLSLAEPLKYLEGGVICKERDYDRSLYMLAEGRLKVSKRHDSGTEKTVTLLEPGDIFGEINFVYGSQRIASVVAIEPSTVYRLSPQQAEEIIRTSDDLYVFLQSLGTRRWVASLLNTLDLFHDVSEENIAKLIQHSNYRILAAGNRLYSPGDTLNTFYILLSGMLEMAHINGTEIEAEHGQCLIPAEAISGHKVSWRASSVSETIIATIPMAQILLERQNNPLFAAKLEKVLVKAS